MIDSLKRSRVWTAGLALLLVLCLALTSAVPPVLANGAPGQPHQFWGNAYINGSLAPSGTTVVAYLDGVSNASTTVDSQGRYGWSPLLYVSGTGTNVTFYVGGTLSPQTAVFEAGGITNLNLFVTTGTLAVATSAASGVGTTTATLNGNLTSLGPNASVNVYFQYGLTTSYGSTTAAQSKSSAGTFNAAISGLTASTTYHYRAVAVGSTTVYGSDMTFTTAAVPSIAVTTSAATGVTSTTATLNGSLTSLGADLSVNVYFRYGLTTSYGTTTATQSMSSTGAFSAAISGLTPGTTYHFQAVAQGSTTAYGSDMTFTASAGTLAVSTSSATNVTATSATLNGNLTSLGGAGSVNVYFQYGLTTSYGSTTATQTKSSTGTFDAAISGLTPSTTYHFRAVAVGSTAYGSDVTFTTVSGGGGSSSPGHQFYGNVYINGVLTSAGTTVAAYVNGVSAASTTTDSSGRYGWSPLFYVPGSSGTVTFYVNGVLVPQTAQWARGGITSLHLYGATGVLTVTTGSGTYVSSTTATLSGTLVSLGTDTSASVSIQYGTTTSYGSSTTAQTMSSTGTFTHTASSLTSGTTYHYRAKAVGSTTVYGSDATYVHTPGGTLAVVTSTATVDTTTATLNGSVTGLGTDTSATVSFEWGTTTSYGNTAAGVPPTLTGTGTFTASLTGLTSGTTYHCRAKAVGSPSSSTVYGSDVTFTPGGGGTGTKLIGANDASAHDEGGPYFLLTRFQAVATGTVTQFKVKAGASSQVKVAIYADSGEPGALIVANNTAQDVASGWNTLSITSTSVTSGTYYWLAVCTKSWGAAQWITPGTMRWKSTTFSTFTFPDPAGSGFTRGSYTDLIAGWTP